MTRGKHGARAQARADEAAVAKIAELEAQLRDQRVTQVNLRVELQKVKDSVSGDLIAARKEAAAIATENLRRELDGAREEIAQRREGFKLLAKSQERLAEAYKRCLIDAGMTGVEAHEQALRVAQHVASGDAVFDVRAFIVATHGDEAKAIFGKHGFELTPDERERLKQFQVAKGFRSR